MGIDRREFLGGLALCAVSGTALFRAAQSAASGTDAPFETTGEITAETTIETIRLSNSEWLQRLTLEQYEVLRHGQTEPAGSSPLNREYREGTYSCAGCDLELFRSEWKYDSRTGWPSFRDAIPGHVKTRKMTLAFRAPTEYHCARCGGHHGHLFEDGPPPTGLRYCSNGVALNFTPASARR